MKLQVKAKRKARPPPWAEWSEYRLDHDGDLNLLDEDAFYKSWKFRHWEPDRWMPKKSDMRFCTSLTR